MNKIFLTLLILVCAAPNVGVAQTTVGLIDPPARPVAHRPLGPGIEPQVRSYVHGIAETLGAFYPDTTFRDVHAVYFRTGAVIVCGELNKLSEDGRPLGWRYFSNSGPLIFESKTREILCDRRSYALPAVTDDHDYGQEFTLAARR
jgi:hypothetical protein